MVSDDDASTMDIGADDYTLSFSKLRAMSERLRGQVNEIAEHCTATLSETAAERAAWGDTAFNAIHELDFLERELEAAENREKILRAELRAQHHRANSPTEGIGDAARLSQSLCSFRVRAAAKHWTTLLLSRGFYIWVSKFQLSTGNVALRDPASPRNSPHIIHSPIQSADRISDFESIEENNKINFRKDVGSLIISAELQKRINSERKFADKQNFLASLSRVEQAKQFSAQVAEINRAAVATAVEYAELKKRQNRTLMLDQRSLLEREITRVERKKFEDAKIDYIKKTFAARLIASKFVEHVSDIGRTSFGMWRRFAISSKQRRDTLNEMLLIHRLSLLDVPQTNPGDSVGENTIIETLPSENNDQHTLIAEIDSLKRERRESCMQRIKEAVNSILRSSLVRSFESWRTFVTISRMDSAMRGQLLESELQNDEMRENEIANVKNIEQIRETLAHTMKQMTQRVATSKLFSILHQWRYGVLGRFFYIWRLETALSVERSVLDAQLLNVEDRLAEAENPHESFEQALKDAKESQQEVLTLYENIIKNRENVTLRTVFYQEILKISRIKKSEAFRIWSSFSSKAIAQKNIALYISRVVDTTFASVETMVSAFLPLLYSHINSKILQKVSGSSGPSASTIESVSRLAVETAGLKATLSIQNERLLDTILYCSFDDDGDRMDGTYQYIKQVAYLHDSRIKEIISVMDSSLLINSKTDAQRAASLEELCASTDSSMARTSSNLNRLTQVMSGVISRWRDTGITRAMATWRGVVERNKLERAKDQELGSLEAEKGVLSNEFGTILTGMVSDVEEKNTLNEQMRSIVNDLSAAIESSRREIRELKDERDTLKKERDTLAHVVKRQGFNKGLDGGGDGGGNVSGPVTNGGLLKSKQLLKDDLAFARHEYFISEN